MKSELNIEKYTGANLICGHHVYESLSSALSIFPRLCVYIKEIGKIACKRFCHRLLYIHQPCLHIYKETYSERIFLCKPDKRFCSNFFARHTRSFIFARYDSTDNDKSYTHFAILALHDKNARNISFNNES